MPKKRINWLFKRQLNQDTKLKQNAYKTTQFLHGQILLLFNILGVFYKYLFILFFFIIIFIFILTIFFNKYEQNRPFKHKKLDKINYKTFYNVS